MILSSRLIYLKIECVESFRRVSWITQLKAFDRSQNRPIIFCDSSNAHDNSLTEFVIGSIVLSFFLKLNCAFTKKVYDFRKFEILLNHFINLIILPLTSKSDSIAQVSDEL